MLGVTLSCALVFLSTKGHETPSSPGRLRSNAQAPPKGSNLVHEWHRSTRIRLPSPRRLGMGLCQVFRLPDLFSAHWRHPDPERRASISCPLGPRHIHTLIPKIIKVHIKYHQKPLGFDMFGPTHIRVIRVIRGRFFPGHQERPEGLSERCREFPSRVGSRSTFFVCPRITRTDTDKWDPRTSPSRYSERSLSLKSKVSSAYADLVVILNHLGLCSVP
ncbi:hypothetical protein SCOR_33685 [Sulfidibacter corallicola]